MEEKPKETILSIENKEFEIKDVPIFDKEKNIEEKSEIQNNNILNEKYDEKLNEIENKIKMLENDILSLQLKKDIINLVDKNLVIFVNIFFIRFISLINKVNIQMI